jgi:siroheme synthase (precorrin-2 oxidase/ferrochelatase)
MKGRQLTNHPLKVLIVGAGTGGLCFTLNESRLSRILNKVQKLALVWPTSVPAVKGQRLEWITCCI